MFKTIQFQELLMILDSKNEKNLIASQVFKYSDNQAIGKILNLYACKNKIIYLV